MKKIGKLAKNENYLGNRAGSKVVETCINYVKEHGSKKIVLLSLSSVLITSNPYI